MIPQEKGALGVGYYKTTPLFKMEGTIIFSPSLSRSLLTRVSPKVERSELLAARVLHQRSREAGFAREVLAARVRSDTFSDARSNKIKKKLTFLQKEDQKYQ
jgi:hypothetical protein